MLPLGEVDERSMCNELKACGRDKTSERIQNNNTYTIMSQSVLEFESWGRGGGIIDYILLIPRQLHVSHCGLTAVNIPDVLSAFH